MKPLIIFWILFIRFGTNLYRQIVGIPLGTNCVSFEADKFLFCYERGFIKSKKICNDQELIQSDPISCPQNQKGNN